MNNPYLPIIARISNVKLETAIEYTFRLETDLKPRFGQFFQISLPRIGECPISVSAFGSGWIELTIRKMGRVTDAIHELSIGGKLFIRGPYGRGFDLKNYRDKHLIIVAGGSGVAPVRSLIQHIYKNTQEVGYLSLLLGFKNAQSILFKDEINLWQKRFPTILTVDEACEAWEGECVGFVTAYVKDLNFSNKDNIAVIVVGPPLMMKFTVAEFEKHGVTKEQIWVSCERLMSCGLGKCGHCKIDTQYICLDGPVFNCVEAERLID